MLSFEGDADRLACQDLLEWCCLSAAEHGNFKAVNVLVESGASVNCVDWYKRTPLILAARSGCSKTVEMLLGLDADTECTDYQRKSALR